ncbi:tehB [Symbiodinium natans]|uniref:TehB protein n=1 Tax=Symbiodinium natans TaxID=878477 RepID=A0A812SHN9_9DINO|nr:tehB [Symbiodinium natans]
MATRGSSWLVPVAVCGVAAAVGILAVCSLRRRTVAAVAPAFAYTWKKLPREAYCYKVNKQWNRDTFPKGFLTAHNTKVGVWAELTVLSGQLHFHILDGKTGLTLASCAVGPEERAVVEPQQYHRVELAGPVEAVLRFYRLPEPDGSKPLTTPAAEQ